MTEYDNYFQAAAILVVQRQMSNTSLIQRKFRIGYNRAGKLRKECNLLELSVG